MTTLLTPATLSRAGVSTVMATADVAAGDEWPNTGAEFVYIYNGSAGTLVVTFPIRQLVDGGALAVASLSANILTATGRVFGPFPTAIYNDGSSRAKVTYSGNTGDARIKAIKYTLP